MLMKVLTKIEVQGCVCEWVERGCVSGHKKKMQRFTMMGKKNNCRNSGAKDAGQKQGSITAQAG